MSTDVPEGMVIAPAWRGYAHLGLGDFNYLLAHSSAGEPAELVICPPTEKEKADRTIGNQRETADNSDIPGERMAIRIRFENVQALDALEWQLRLLREKHFSDGASGDAP